MKALTHVVDADSTGRQQVLSSRSRIDVRRNVDLDHSTSDRAKPWSSTQRIGCQAASAAVALIGSCALSAIVIVIIDKVMVAVDGQSKLRRLPHNLSVEVHP